LLLLLLAPVACSETAPTERVSVVDSAGVRIVMSPDRDTSPRTVAVEPQFTLGGIEVEGPTQFGYIDNVVVDPAGQIWVSDAQASELRVFSPEGDHIGMLGGPETAPASIARSPSSV
jgi:sugar lactone lactonase YvrE